MASPRSKKLLKLRMKRRMKRRREVAMSEDDIIHVTRELDGITATETTKQEELATPVAEEPVALPVLKETKKRTRKKRTFKSLLGDD